MSVASNIPAPGTPVVAPDGRMSPVWFQFFMTLFSRTGGAQGVSSGDLSLELSGDAGVEELKAQVFGLRDVVYMAPPTPPAMPNDDQGAPMVPVPAPDDPNGRIEALEAVVQRLQIEIEAIRQGQQL